VALHDWRRVPFAGERVGLRGVKTHSQVERSLRRGKPVGFLVGTRTFILEIEVERAIRVDLERHPITNGKAIETIRNLKALIVVERDRPKSIRWRGGALVEVDHVLVGAVEWFARVVG
jgi:hypothetical protein